MKFHKALFPVDLEDVATAEHALKYLKETLRSDQKLYLLSVMPGMNMPLVASYFPEGAIENAISVMRHQLETLASQVLGDDVDYEVLVEEGKPHNLIIETAKRLDCDLIAMPSRNHSLLEKVLIGSVTAKVVEQAECSVYVMR